MLIGLNISLDFIILSISLVSLVVRDKRVIEIMGNDMQVFQEKDEIDDIFLRMHGPKDESTLSFFRRGYDGFCNSIANPVRSKYSKSDLQFPGYRASEFILLNHRAMVLQCCHWKNLANENTDEGIPPISSKPPVCVLYLHTNTRNLSDAVEVIPFCNRLAADFISFDFEGMNVF
jgi:hypothetical protein